LRVKEKKNRTSNFGHYRKGRDQGVFAWWLWSARPSDQTMVSQSSVATGHPTLFGTLAQPSLDIFRLCLWRPAGSPTSGNQSSNRPLCAARSRAPKLRWIFTYEESQAEGVDLAPASLAEGEKTEGKHVNEPRGVQRSPRATASNTPPTAFSHLATDGPDAVRQEEEPVLRPVTVPGHARHDTHRASILARRRRGEATRAGHTHTHAAQTDTLAPRRSRSAQEGARPIQPTSSPAPTCPGRSVSTPSAKPQAPTRAKERKEGNQSLGSAAHT
jgi:hypothetical protein